MVTLAVVATLVANSKAPPAKMTLQALHFQIPQESLLTLVYIMGSIPFRMGGIDT